MRFYFSTPVWGEGHIDVFLKVGLPSLLARGNLPSLSDARHCRYLLYTRSADMSSIRSSAAFKALSKLVPVDVLPIEEPIESPHTTMSDCHADSLRRADEEDVGVVFIPPDCVWANGSIRHLERLADEGKSVVHMSGVRLLKETFMPQFLKRKRAANGAMAIASRDLVKLGLKHLHPIAFTHFWNEYDGGLLPANLYWTVPGEGLLLRCFHLHPLYVKPQVKGIEFVSTIDDDLALAACPDQSREYVVTDSDQILAFELSGRSHVTGAPFEKGSVESVAGWAEFGTNMKHRELGKNVIRLHSKDIDPSAWAPIERQAETVMREAAAINRKSTIALALQYPAMMTWRMYALSLGKGRYWGDRSIRMHILRGLRLLLRPAVRRWRKNSNPDHRYAWRIRRKLGQTRQALGQARGRVLGRARWFVGGVYRRGRRMLIGKPEAHGRNS